MLLLCLLAGGSGGAMKSNPGNVCRYGRSCHRSECYYTHPDGRDIDDSAGEENWEDDLAELGLQESDDEQDDFICPCKRTTHIMHICI